MTYTVHNSASEDTSREILSLVERLDLLLSATPLVVRCEGKTRVTSAHAEVTSAHELRIDDLASAFSLAATTALVKTQARYRSRAMSKREETRETADYALTEPVSASDLMGGARRRAVSKPKKAREALRALSRQEMASIAAELGFVLAPSTEEDADSAS